SARAATLTEGMVKAMSAPKQKLVIIDLVPAEGGPDVVKAIRGIYALEGDTLTLSWFLKDSDSKRPTDFSARPGSRQFVWRLRRARQMPPAGPAKEPALVGTRAAEL